MSEIMTDSLPLKDRLVRNGFWMYAAMVVIAPAWYLIKMIVSRELSVEDIWLIYSIIGLIGLLSAYNDFGLTEALQYYLPQYLIDKKYNEAKSILIITRIIQFLWWMVVWWFLYRWAPRLAIHYFQSPIAAEILRYFSFYFLLINFFQVLQSVFISLQEVKLQYVSEIIRIRSVVLAVTYLWWYQLLTIETFALTWLWWVLLCVIVTVYLFKKYMQHRRSIWIYTRDRWLLKTQWTYARKIMIGMQVGMIYANIGQQFAIYFLGPYEAGIWTNYMTFFTGVSVIVWPINAYLFPLFTELYKKQEQAKINLIKKYLIAGVLFATVCFGIGGWFLSERTAVILLSEKFLTSGTMFKRTSLWMFFILASRVQFQLLAGAGFVQERVNIVIIGTTLHLIISLIGVHTYGIWWLMWAMIITHVYFWWHSMWYIRKFKL